MRRSPFVFSVAPLRRDPGLVLHRQVAGPLPGLVVTSTRVLDDAEVSADLALENAHPGVMAHGTVRAPWIGECRRCAGPATGELEAEVRELFQSRGDPEETYPLHGDQLDAEPLVRDAVLLELPQAPLCAEGCQGLCPMCGTDRNAGGCQCDEPVTDIRWAALDVLRSGEATS